MAFQLWLSWEILQRPPGDALTPSRLRTMDEYADCIGIYIEPKVGVDYQVGAPQMLIPGPIKANPFETDLNNLTKPLKSLLVLALARLRHWLHKRVES